MAQCVHQLVDPFLDDLLESVQRDLSSVIECYERLEFLPGRLGQLLPSFLGLAGGKENLLQPTGLSLAVLVDRSLQAFFVRQVSPFVRDAVVTP